METNEPIDTGYDTDLNLTAAALDYLRSVAGWSQFLAVLGFVGIGFMVLVGLILGVAMSSVPGTDQLPFPSFVFSIIYLLLGVVYFFPVLYLYRFSNKTKQAFQFGSSEELADAFYYLKAHYKFIGILTIALIGLYLVGIVVSIAIGLSF